MVLTGQDLLAIAQTGTGKTAAFSLPILQHLMTNKTGTDSIIPKALILAPTRELASQIHSTLDGYANGLGLKTCAVFGGTGQADQVRILKHGVDILVATPGRLLDLIKQGHIRLGKIEILVLDEADRMLDMGFSEEIDEVISHVPKKRQTILFSATMPDSVAQFAYNILTKPKRIQLTPKTITVEKITQKVIFCRKVDKFQLLKKILKESETELVIIFTKTKNMADKVKEYLMHNRIAATVFHGDKDQKDRERALNNFKVGSFKILIATDIAARGIDIQGISHVVNFEFPMEAESYVHRIGRTARAGKEGSAISFCDDNEKGMLEKIEQLIRLKIPSEKYQGVPEAAGIWLQEGSIRKVTAPTPGKSQEKTAYLDHSKRRKILAEGEAKPKSHPGFKNQKKKKR